MVTLNKILNDKNGVTFIELIVVISIFSIIAGITLFNFSSFSTGISIQNLSHDIALTINEAQKDAINGKDPIDGSIPAYGVFSKDNPKSFVYFKDNNPLSTSDYYSGDKSYNEIPNSNCDGITECQKIFNIQGGSTIEDIFVYDNGAYKSVYDLNIVFVRPFPKPFITYCESTGNTSCGISGRAYIKITSAKGAQKFVAIS